VFAGVIIAWATSLFFSGARADSKGDWAKCLSTEKLPYAEVISSCTAALASGTDSWAASRAYYLLGDAHFHNGDLEAAVADFSQVIHFYPNSVQGYRGRGAAYFRQQKFDLAIADYTRVIEIDPKDSNTDVYFAYAYRGETYAAKDDLDRGIADASMAIEINPQAKFGYRLRGRMYATKGNVELAIADYNRVLQSIPKMLTRTTDVPGCTSRTATLILRSPTTIGSSG
jgi:tetratricopeptide (TPR) repeat protein